MSHEIFCQTSYEKLVPLNLANSAEATAEIIQKIAGLGAIYLKHIKMAEMVNVRIIRFPFLTMNQGWLLKDSLDLKIQFDYAASLGTWGITVFLWDY